MSARGRLPPLPFPTLAALSWEVQQLLLATVLTQGLKAQIAAQCPLSRKDAHYRHFSKAQKGRGVCVCVGGRGTLSSMILSELNPFTCFSGTRAHSTRHSKLFALLLPSWTLAIETASALPTSAYICLCLTLEREKEKAFYVCVCMIHSHS